MKSEKKLKPGSPVFTTDVGPLFAVWYHCFRVNKIIALFSRTPTQGEFLEALERTLDSSVFYVETVWKIASDMREKEFEWVEINDAIREWSHEGNTSWYRTIDANKTQGS
jgi:hypothetical protein